MNYLSFSDWIELRTVIEPQCEKLAVLKVVKIWSYERVITTNPFHPVFSPWGRRGLTINYKNSHVIAIRFSMSLSKSYKRISTTSHCRHGPHDTKKTTTVISTFLKISACLPMSILTRNVKMSVRTGVTPDPRASRDSWAWYCFNRCNKIWKMYWLIKLSRDALESLTTIARTCPKLVRNRTRMTRER